MNIIQTRSIYIVGRTSDHDGMNQEGTRTR